MAANKCVAEFHLAGSSLALPPLTIFLATVLLSNSERFGILVVLIIFSILSVFIGILQVGASSVSTFLRYTNRGEAVGLFANRNHLAALLYCALVFLCSMGNQDLDLSLGLQQNNRAAAKIYLPILDWGLALLIILGATEMITRSRAGASTGAGRRSCNWCIRCFRFAPRLAEENS